MGRDEQRVEAARQRAVELIRVEAVVVDRDRHRSKVQGLQQVELSREGRILDPDSIAGPEVCLQDAFESVEGAADEAQINVAMIAVGWGVLAWIVPPYARDIGIGPSLIGLLLLANAATVVFAQLPIVKAAEGRSRVGALSLGASTWVVACLFAVLAQAVSAELAFVCLVAAAVAFAVGECLHATAFMPLIADLAPLALRGRSSSCGLLSLRFQSAFARSRSPDNAPSAGTWRAPCNSRRNAGP